MSRYSCEAGQESLIGAVFGSDLCAYWEDIEAGGLYKSSKVHVLAGRLWFATKILAPRSDPSCGPSQSLCL